MFQPYILYNNEDVFCFLDILCGEDYGDTVNISRKKMHGKFGDHSFQNTTSTPVKSPLIPVSAIIMFIESCTKNKIQLSEITIFRAKKLFMTSMMSRY